MSEDQKAQIQILVREVFSRFSKRQTFVCYHTSIYVIKNCLSIPEIYTYFSLKKI